ncbi:hypothetical protein [Erythrobacter litoralis]|uniref:DUF11 domain-containing protein n=1 Tax=Erythrobacter litoralis (strain HTCC2594) TaxID=314225 RepID=Q2NB15_ERYLH|nr:hypothetical protein [Erythrobacter litoralis]ABC63126.1 hypothetical protein ELI_05170 [Erythrobacter litoralis HTCC2594]
MRNLLLFGSLACLAAGGVAANSGVAIEKSVYVERADVRAGKPVRALEPAEEVRKGDTVVLMLEWNAPGRERSFTVSSRVPRDLAFQRSGGKAPQVSIDGGRNWGDLAELRIGARRASPEDVTHLRWQVSNAEAALGRGVLTYSAIVR